MDPAFSLLAAPIVTAGVTAVTRRWPRLTSGIGAGFTALFWLWLRLLELDEPAGTVLLIYGRSLTLTEGTRSLFLLLLVGLWLLLLLSLVWPQGRYFVPASIALLSPIGGMVMIRPFSFGALFWLMAVSLLVVIILSDRAGQTQAALRFLVLAVLAVPLLLVASWMLETGQGAFQVTAGRLLVFALAILLAGFPFHIWVRPIIDEIPGFGVIILFGLVQLALAMYLFDILANYTWLQEEPAFHSFLQWSSGLAAVTAGFLALMSLNYSQLVGSLILLDMSVSLSLLLVPVEMGRETAVVQAIVRFVSLLLIVVAFNWLSQRREGEGFLAYRGLGRREPVTAVVLAFGMASLLGFPLTIGFSGRWIALTLIAQQPNTSVWLPIAFLLAMGGGIYGVWRGLAPLLSAGLNARLSKPNWMWVILAAGLIMSLVMAIRPQLIFSYASRLAEIWLQAAS